MDAQNRLNTPHWDRVEPTPRQLLLTAKRCADRPAYFVRNTDTGQWDATLWRDFMDEIRCAARALLALGVRKGDAVCIMGFNRPE